MGEISKGRKLVISGRRNTGKTSLLRNVIIPAYRSGNKPSFVLFADLMGLTDLEDLGNRLKLAFQLGLSQAFPAQAQWQSIWNYLKGLKPSFSVDPVTGEPTISIDWQVKSTNKSFETILQNVNEIHLKNKALIVLDEFQDISFVKTAEAKLRAVLQNLSPDLPVIVSGSKKHLMAKIFSVPNAPFASWGRDIDIPTIDSAEYQMSYLKYVNDRFSSNNLIIEKSEFAHLLKMSQRIPEPVNIVCDHIMRTYQDKKISLQDVKTAFIESVSERRTRYEERLKFFRETEKLALINIAYHGPIKKPKGKEFIHLMKKVSPTTVYSTINRLEDQAEIYDTAEGYLVADPLFAEFLRRNR